MKSLGFDLKEIVTNSKIRMISPLNPFEYIRD